MALAPITPRDRLQRLVDLGGKTLRYWWLLAVFAVAGGALSLAFALTRPRVYQAEVVLGYAEQIQSALLTNREEAVNRNIGDRYRELLLASDQLLPIIKDPELDPFPRDTDEQIALDRLRQAVRFESRGGTTFHIVYTDTEPERARRVAAQLAERLQQKDGEMRSDVARSTAEFVREQKENATAELKLREHDLAEFLVLHPEFMLEPGQTSGMPRVKKPTETGSARLRTLERQRARIQALLEAPPGTPMKVVAPASEEKKAAEAAVADAQRELASAQRSLDDARQKYTDEHPAVKSAQKRVTEAQQKLRHAQAAVPPDVEQIIPPTSDEARGRLKTDLAKVESAIADEEKRSQKGGTATSDALTKSIVELDTKHEGLQLRVAEQRKTVATLADAVARAETEASKESKEHGRLTVYNKAEKPSHPIGPGKTIFLLAGMILFLGLGTALAVGLAVIDDRLYRRHDIDQLGVPVLAVIPPHVKRTHALKKEVEA